MALPHNVKDREFKKFAENSNGDTAVRVIITNPLPDDIPQPANLTLNGLQTGSVKEDLAAGAEVGVLTIQEGTGVGSITYTIIQDLSNAFQIAGDRLQTSRILDHNVDPQVNVIVRATDSNNSFTETNFLITVLETEGFQNKFSYEFGANRYITVDNSTYIGASTTTWFTWYKTQQGTSTQNIFNSKRGTNNSGVRLAIYPTTQARDIVIDARDTNNQVKQYEYNFPSSYNENKWNMIGFTLSGQTLKVFLNGQELPIAQTVFNSTLGTVASSGATIGANAGAGGGWFLGLMDEIVYSNANFSNSTWILCYNNGVCPDYDVLFPTVSEGFRNWYRAEDVNGSGDPLPVVKDRKGAIDAVAQGVTLNVDTPIAFSDLFRVEFDTTNYFLGSGVPDFTTAKSFSFWLERNNTSATELIYTNGSGASSTDAFRIYLDNNNNNRVVFEMRTGSTRMTKRFTLGSASINQDTHVVITMPAGNIDANNIKLYSNTVEISGQITFNTLSGLPPVNDILSIGAGTNGVSGLDSKLNEFIVFDIECSLAQVEEIYKNNSKVDVNELSFIDDAYQWWRFGDKNNLTSVMTDQINQKNLVMIGYDISHYVSST